MKKLLTNAFVVMALGVIGVANIGGFALAAPDGSSTPFTQNQNNVGVNVPGGSTLGTQTTPGQEPQFITTVKNAINLVLGFLALIALVILLWGGFQMVTAAGDENKYKKGFTILKQAGIGLIFIGLAALFVNLIFWFINSVV